jgi:acetyl-CoA synthetase
VILKAGVEKSDSLAEELRNHVGHEIGPIAKPEDIQFVDNLPKTRSGKIMRRLLRTRALGLPDGDVSTLEE